MKDHCPEHGWYKKPRTDCPKCTEVSKSAPEMLTAAMEMAVKTGMFPKHVPLDKYSENWKCMELVIEAALKVRQP